MNHLLLIHVEVTVPFAIDDLARRGGPVAADFEAARGFAGELGSKGDQIFFRGPQTKQLVGDLARHVATMAFVPGGIEFGGTRWCGRHNPRGFRGPCPQCLNVAAVGREAHQAVEKGLQAALDLHVLLL